MALIIGMLAVLGICSVTDLLYQRVWIPLVIAIIPYTLLCLYFADAGILANVVCGVVVGGLFYVVSIVTEGQIGKADGLLLGVMALALGFWRSLSFLMLCFIYAFVAALVLVVIFHKKKKTRMPFVPFMLLGYITILVLGRNVI